MSETAPSNIALLASVFDALPVGVIVLDASGRVVVYNRYEEQLAGRTSERVIGRRFFHEIAPCLRVRQLGLLFEERIGRGPIQEALEVSFPMPMVEFPRDVAVRMQSFEAGGAPFALLTVEDVSARRAVDRMKEQLSELLVHDLKNPLAVVLGTLGLLRRDQPSSIPSNLVALDVAIDSAKRLQAMLVRLLDIARLETSTFRMVPAAVDVGVLVERAAREAEAGRIECGVTIARELREPLVAVLDADVVTRILDNLVQNAMRYARSRIVLRAELDESSVRIEVEDDGVGVPERYRESVFDKYAQPGQDVDPAGHNRGLGLTFVRLAARAHGGSVDVVDAHPGARFRVTLGALPGP